jgi:FkbM family methyltransferase
MQSSPLRIRLSNHVILAVPPSLESITTYVLLEQERWFEKELSFLSRWLKPGMTAVDVGANLGAYSLPIARLVGSHGHVFAYEPGSEARALLELSRDINIARNLHIFDLALSNGEREGRLLTGASSELNALGDAGAGEPVHITSLDIESRKHGWSPPDFIKIDAEGEEERILAGGQDFFGEHSPLVMFEIKAADGVINEQLRAMFPAIGYQLFRLLVGVPILVPLDPRLPLDPSELNIFACKPDRIRSLRDEGFLVDRAVEWTPNSEAISNGLSVLRQQAFAPMFGQLLENVNRIECDYASALAAFAVWRAEVFPAHTRCGALFFAHQALAALCNRAPTTARYSTLARVAWEGGWRDESVTALQRIAGHLQRMPFQPIEPCWPANPRFDDIAVGNSPALWFATGVMEQLERAQSYSTYFSGMSPWLTFLCEQSTASREMHRRKVLLAARRGANPIIPLCLRQEAPDHLNADIWRSGMVPGTHVGL